MKFMRKHWFYLCLIVFFSITVHAYHFFEPIYDRHNFRQTDTFAVAQRINRGEAGLFTPRYFHTHDPANTERYFLAEFPLYEALIVWGFKLFGEFVWVARLVSIGLTVTASLALFWLVEHWFDEKVAVFAAVLFNLFPTMLFWGRGVSPDVFALTMFMLGLSFQVAGKRPWMFWVSSGFFSLAVLTKMTYLIFLPLHAALIFVERDKTEQIKPETQLSMLRELLRYYLLPIGFLLLWRGWIATFDPSSRADPRFTGLMYDYIGYLAFWRQSDWPSVLLTGRLFSEVLTPLGGLLAVCGLLYTFAKRPAWRMVPLAWVATCLALSLIISWGSFVHDYYLLPWLPLAATFAAVGVVQSWRQVQDLWKEHRTGIERLFIAGLLIVFGVVAVWWGPVALFAHARELYGLQQYSLYSESFEADYVQLREIVLPSERALVVMAEYTPYMLNMIEREGNVLAVSPNKVCPTPEEFFTLINDLQRIEPKEYVILQNQDYYPSSCSRATLASYMFGRYPLAYKGTEVEMYRLQEPTLEITGDSQVLVLTAQNLGGQARLEIGGLPGSASTVLIEPEWQQLSDGSRQVTITDAQEWLSFKIYWENPIMVSENPAWVISTDGWALRQF